MSEGKSLLQYVPFESCVDPTFWHKFAQLKLDVDKLEEKVRPVWGYYSYNYNRMVNVDCTSFNKEFGVHSNFWIAKGYQLNTNTLESFKNLDKVKFLEDYGKIIKEDVKSGEAAANPSTLATFILITFADLKKYHFYYWFGFPASSKPVCHLQSAAEELNKSLSEEQINLLYEKHGELPLDQQGFFGVSIKDSVLSLHSLKEMLDIIRAEDSVHEYHWGFVDPCDDPQRPGWPLRNLLLLVYLQCPNLREETLSVICLRKRGKSIVLRINFEGAEEIVDEKWIGWELNTRAKFGPRFVDLSSNMNPVKLAEESVDLNLRLMKWRLAPDLDLASVKTTSCLLLGSGTLGCSVARALLAWGVETITLVDNGTVSYSNPVRQSLFTFEDCQRETNKAEAAAAALKQIFPGVKSRGVKLTISMPGRGVNDIDSVAELEKLISEHDVVFLLTDTRESRWLPTLLAAKHNKVAITAALGFDTYLVLRHGMAASSQRLGCYFCNDVTAPGNSTQDRTLDQQCTVTRPGVSHIAAALAVELMVSLVQHSERGAAGSDSSSCLGQLPHSIRGFLSTYSQMMPSTPAFSQCTACSTKVVKEYENRGLEFLKDVFMRTEYLEELTGLSELQKATDFSEILEFSDDEEM
ncbi:ubiquitin-like modifier-activating enzyme ATG7 [Macrosteles quadrilineatus]|uniref:ubiquitin-like modifier-activating enzyme ATG7 n=1 Tax=Macrosteles quadrilineatus TaxID=74068 RepID=UPI0023E278F6|nr:ubiquitin-like modifier-activating enzyme ATG7 [Macrosteles quadrilineatus]